MRFRSSAASVVLSIACFAACAEGGEPTGVPRDLPPLHAEPVRKPSAPGARIEVRAPIARLGVRVAESFPPQYFADVTSALPDGCSRFARSAVRREGTTVYVDVFNTHPASDEMRCSMLYGEHDESVALGSDFSSGTSYTVDANGTRQAFVAQ